MVLVFWGPPICLPPSLEMYTNLSGKRWEGHRYVVSHVSFRRALANLCNEQWSIGSLKNNWEWRIDDQVSLLVAKMNERAEKKDTVCLSDKVA